MSALISRDPIFDKKSATFAYDIQLSGLEILRFGEGESGGIDHLHNFREMVLDWQTYQYYKEAVKVLPKEKIYLKLNQKELRFFEENNLRVQGLHLMLEMDDFSSDLVIPESADVIAFDSSKKEVSGLATFVEKLHHLNKKVLIKGVDTHKQFQDYQSNGADFFQGKFHLEANPEMKKVNQNNTLMIMQLLSVLSLPDCLISDVEQAIVQDPRLAYRIIKTVNSPLYGLSRPVENLHDAILYLGLQTIRQWAMLSALSNIEGKAEESLSVGMRRARMAEELAIQKSFSDPSQFYMAGLFSTLGALLDQPLEELLSQMRLPTTIKAGLLDYQGEIGETLYDILLYEKGLVDYEKLIRHDPESMAKTYLSGLVFADNQSALMKE